MENHAWISVQGIQEVADLLADPETTLADLHAYIKAHPYNDFGGREAVEHVAQFWPQRPYFVPVRLSEIIEGEEIEHDDTYVLAMISALGDRGDKFPIREFMLRHDRELREDIFWRIFEVEGGGEVSLANVDKFSSIDASWKTTIVTLVVDGTLDRQRVLRSCLEALNRDFSAYRAGWFSRMYTALKPTIEDVERDQDVLMRCLGSVISSTVSFAIKEVARLDKNGHCDEGLFLAHVGPALMAGKGVALSALKILQGCTSDQADLLIAEAVGHPHDDVQRAAIKALRAQGREDLVISSADLLSPLVAQEMGLHAGAFPPISEQPDQSQEQLAPGGDAQKTVGKVEPITDENALERLSAMLARHSEPIEWELALAWLAQSDNASEILEPLKTRWLTSPLHIPFSVAVRAEVEPYHLRRLEWAYSSEISANVQHIVYYCWHSRLFEVVDILLGDVPRYPLVATPTHVNGVIDGEVFRFRIQQACEVFGCAQPCELLEHIPADLMAASLRLSDADRQKLSEEMGIAFPIPTADIKVRWYPREYEDAVPGKGLVKKCVWRVALAHPQGTKFTTKQWASGKYACSERGLPSVGSERGGVEISLASISAPYSPAYFVNAAIEFAEFAVGEIYYHVSDHILAALRLITCQWSPEVVQLLALSMSSFRAEIRAEAAEVFCELLPSRVSLDVAAQGFADCVQGCKVNRWAKALEDAASLSPAYVLDFLMELLPRLERAQHSIGALLKLALNEMLRQGRTDLPAPLKEWLSGFTGSSAAAKTARSLRALGV
ncbi:MAG: DUF6493 family protein [Actinomycetaceae bacterium]|nr:DUF6493 family protein [Actinomycetaceae bacterium]